MNNGKNLAKGNKNQTKQQKDLATATGKQHKSKKY